MGVGAFVPIQVAFQIDHSTLSQTLNGLIQLGVGTGQVVLNAEAILSAVLGQSHIDIGIPLAVLEGDAGYGHALEADQLVHFGFQLLSAQQSGHVLSLSYVAVSAFDDFQSGIHDLDFAGPNSLLTGNANLSAGDQLCSNFLGAVYFVCEVCALSVLQVNGNLAVTSLVVEPPGLVSLNVGLNADQCIGLSSHEVSVGHDLGGGLSSNLLVFATSNQSNCHGQHQQQCNQFLHVSLLLFCSVSSVSPVPTDRFYAFHYTYKYWKINGYSRIFSA